MLMRSLVALTFVLLFVHSAKAQPPSRFCHGVLDEQVILEVSVLGHGMIWPNFIPHMFFRLYRDGQVIFDERTKTKLVGRNIENLCKFPRSSRPKDFNN